MNLERTLLAQLPDLPWLVALAVLLVAALLAWRRAERLQGERDAQRESEAQVRAELAAAAARVDAGERELARVLALRATEGEAARAELAALRGQFDALREQAGLLERGRAAAEARLGRLPELSAELAAERAAHAALAERHAALETAMATLRTETAARERAAQDKLALLEQSEARLVREFENLANRIFEDKQQRFAESSKAGVEALLAPVREQLGEFRRKVEDIYDQENRDRASLRTELGQLKSLNERIGSEALNLTRALKGDAKLRGTWGEVQLERLLEQSGLARGREYDVQASLRAEDGQRFQPDVIVHLPEHKDVIIDSKVSLVAYEQYHASEDDDVRRHHAEQHVASLRAHIKGLAEKNYDDLVGVNSLDVVIMFVPIEPALLLAYEHQPALYTEAFTKGILLVSPSTLMGTLRIIHSIWRHEQQNRNTLEIAQQAGALYDDFVRFVETLLKVGEALERARREFDAAAKKLSTGKGNLVNRSHRLRLLGVKAKKSLPDALVEEAAAEDGELLEGPDGDGDD